MDDLDKYYSGYRPTSEEFRVWMTNAPRELAERHSQFVYDKVHSEGDTWWEDHLEIAIEIMQKRFGSLTVPRACSAPAT